MLTVDEIDLAEGLFVLNKDKLEEIVQPSELDIKLFDALDKSLMLSEYSDCYYYKSYKLLHSEGYASLILAQLLYELRNGKYNLGNAELQLIGVKQLNTNYGNIFLRPEKSADKIAEFFTRTEIDYYDYPLFSSKYYLLADDEHLCHCFSTPQRIALIEQQHEISIQVIQDLLIAKFSRILTREDYEGMIALLEGM